MKLKRCKRSDTTDVLVMKMMMNVLKCMTMLVTMIGTVVEAKLMEGDLKVGDNWAFMARFCFLSMHGKFEYDIEYPVDYEVQNLDLYYDTESQWPLVYGDKSNLTTCREKESVLQVRKTR